MATTLRAGDRGELVKRLQAALISFGFDLGTAGADGAFGNRTKVAVKSFQSEHSLPATGAADPDTIAAMDLDPVTLAPFASPGDAGRATLVSVERAMHGSSVRLVFDRDLSVPDVGRFVFERAVPRHVEISIDMGQLGAFELTGVTFDVVRQMREDVATLVATAPETAPQGSWGGAATPPGEVPVEMSEDELAEWVHHQLEARHVIGHVAEVVGIFATHASKLAVVAEILSPVGMIASVIIVGWETWRAFGTGTRLQDQEGFCYGVVWEATDTPNQTKVFWAPWAGDSEDELREAFYEGVAKGRSAAQEPKVRNGVLLVAGHLMAQGTQEELAFRFVLEGLYEKINELGLKGRVLTFPTPPDFPWR